MSQAETAPDHLFADQCMVQSHGDHENNSVGITIPSDACEVLNISLDATLSIYGFEDRVEMRTEPADKDELGALSEDGRGPVRKGSSYQINIPNTPRRVLDLERGELMQVYTFDDHLTVMRAADVIGVEQ